IRNGPGKLLTPGAVPQCRLRVRSSASLPSIQLDDVGTVSRVWVRDGEIRAEPLALHRPHEVRGHVARDQLERDGAALDLEAADELLIVGAESRLEVGLPLRATVGR